jgi:glycosyltransferase involved in cell wall biosynthesis
VHVIALVESSGHVCCRYRIAALRRRLENHGHRLELRPLPHGPWEWIRLGQALRRAEAVILQRKLLQGWQRRLVRQAARVLVYDFDDAVLYRDSYAVRGLHSGTRMRRFAATVQTADIVVAGNEFLREQAAQFTDGSRVRVVPTCVEPSAYRPAGHTRSAGVRLVWIGSSSTLKGLERAAPILERIGTRWPGANLHLVCDRELALRHLPVLFCPWSEEGEKEVLPAADVGISWMPDDLWSRGKCGLKVLQYLAAGLPVVANPVGVHRDMVRPGETGYLAETPEQWTEAVGKLAADAALRRQMGQAGRALVERDYSVDVAASRWLALLSEVGPRRKAA